MGRLRRLIGLGNPTILFSWFRFLFGVLMIPQTLHLVPHVHDLAQSTFVFHYAGLEFIEAYSHELIDFLSFLAVLGSVLLALGIIPRLSALLFLIGFGYLFLIDRSFYNNHYYLWCLIAILFVFSEVNKSISIFDVLKKNFNKPISIYNFQIFALLFSIVYFYGGIVKINGDWMQGYPMRLLTSSRSYPFPDFLGLFISWSGMFFDLFIWILLIRFPKKWFVFVPYLLFHLTNYFVFNIGEFPLVMIACILIFIPLGEMSIKELIFIKNLRIPKFKLAFLSFFFLFQFLFPLRSLLIDGNTAWHRQGYDFSWRMMLNNYEVSYFQFKVVIVDKKDEYFVDFNKLLTYRQYYHAYHDPYMIFSLAQKLKSDAQKKYRSKRVQVYCRSSVKLNQHPFRELINSSIDLGHSKYYLFRNNNFINSF